jgi:acetyl-CoA synthetase
MMKLTDYHSYADAQRTPIRTRCGRCSMATATAEHRARVHHPPCRRQRPRRGALAHSDGRDEHPELRRDRRGRGALRALARRERRQPGDRIAFMLEPSLPFYVCLFGAMQTGAISVPLFTLFGPDALRLRVDDCKPTILITNAEKAELARQIDGVRA